VRLPELDEMLADLIARSDHPEITGVEIAPDSPDDHTRLVVSYASGATSVVMVRQVARAGRRSAEYEIPREVV
jgi:hypothetical protein